MSSLIHQITEQQNTSSICHLALRVIRSGSRSLLETSAWANSNPGNRANPINAENLYLSGSHGTSAGRLPRGSSGFFRVPSYCFLISQI